ncbi:hypothetical protein C8039_18570 [Halogeometricum sp. wsp3]|nr:hypothetical protein C8039_18570 [Halogeometricum sp. wsp3]
MNACECVEQRFEAYETYVKAYRELDETLNDSISERAGTGDRLGQLCIREIFAVRTKSSTHQME